MENTFFLPVGREILVDTQSGSSYRGELLGLINLAGIPAVWLREKRTKTQYEHIVPITAIHGLTIQKELSAAKDGLIKL